MIEMLAARFTLPNAMSIARVLSFAFSGIEPVPVEVQVQIASGLPAFLIAVTVFHMEDRDDGSVTPLPAAALSRMIEP